MPIKTIAAADEPSPACFTWEHPLAGVASLNCQKHASLLTDLLGGVACGACWSDALFDDFMFAAENELPIAVEVDPFYIDEIAVELALKGKPVTLTMLERNEVNRRLHQIAERRNLRKRYRHAPMPVMAGVR